MLFFLPLLGRLLPGEVLRLLCWCSYHGCAVANSALAAGLGLMRVAACTSKYWCVVSFPGAP